MKEMLASLSSTTMSSYGSAKSPAIRKFLNAAICSSGVESLHKINVLYVDFFFIQNPNSVLEGQLFSA